MYENDYSWIPSFFGGFMALAALGGLAIAFIEPDTTRSRALWTWLLVPVFLSIGLATVAALFGENLETYSPILFLPVFTVIFSPPWLIAAGPAYGFIRLLRARALQDRTPR